jgi:crooked neck
MDKSELEDYKLRKRRTFEEKVRKQKNLIGHWVKYAVWEESL